MHRLNIKIDFITVLLYLVLVAIGWLSIYSAVHDGDNSSVFDLSQRYGMQLVWIGVSLMLCVLIILVDTRYFHIFAYHSYIICILLMVGVMLFGREVNGARSWIGIGPIGIQPVEFMKIATALALARFMSSSHFNIGERKMLVYVGSIIFVPIFLILLQNDTGSALIFSAFFIVLFREGFGASIYLVSLYLTLVSVLTFFLTPGALVLLVFVSCVGFELYSRRRTSQAVKVTLRYLALIALLYLLVEGIYWIVGTDSSIVTSLLIATLSTLPILIFITLKGYTRSTLNYFWLFVAGVGAIFVVDYAFENILQEHQQERILDLIGIESDPRGAGYNAMQSKIAIGSGGLLGKGYMQGTQTRFSFVPEQSTDFIFCTVGEEWGFIGSVVVVALFVMLILRLMRMGEKQKEPFARIYCYCVASILSLHVLINISMTIGLFPVIGIPLPFFSYGGSSLMAFSIMLFIALRLDSMQRESNAYKN